MNATTTTTTGSPSSPTPLLADGETLGVVGMGVMGCTILKGLLTARALPPERVWGTSRSADTCREVAADLGVPVEPDVRARLASAGVVVLCVKPAQAPVALAALAAAGLRPDALIVSIAAGVDSTQLSTMLGTANPIVRAMPNTPCVVGEGMTAICRGPRATPVHVEQARRIFECVGRAIETEEKHFNAITALSGSGPAYHYLIMEAMADAGVRVGLPRDLALTLVAQTTLGSARMVQTSGRHPAALRDDVTTPAGCTIGGLLMLEDGKIRSVLARAIEEATRIASKLGPAGPSKPAGDPH
jgi:pyrroline-5-carboxylate reductase